MIAAYRTSVSSAFSSRKFGRHYSRRVGGAQIVPVILVKPTTKHKARRLAVIKDSSSEGSGNTCMKEVAFENDPDDVNIRPSELYVIRHRSQVRS